MGSITSRGDDWPPKPYKRLVVRHEVVTVTDIHGITRKIVQPFEDYVWVRPGCEIPNGCGGASTDWTEETSPSQENAIRNLEEN